MFRSTTLSTLFSIGLAIFLLGVLPLWKIVRETQTSIGDTQTLIAELQNLQQKKDQLVKIYNSVSEENIQKLEAVIPSASGSYDASVLYLVLENMARENGLRIESLNITTPEEDVKAKPAAATKPGLPIFQLPTDDVGDVKAPAQTAAAPAPKKTSKSGAQENRVLVNATGSYESLKSFLRAIESNLRIMNVLSITVSPQAERNVFNYSMQLITYHQ